MTGLQAQELCLTGRYEGWRLLDAILFHLDFIPELLVRHL